MSAAADFDEFYGAHGSRLVGQLYLLTGNREEARDCAQEAFERAWLRWEKLRDYDDPAAWVATVARRLAVSRWRKARSALTAGRRAHREDDAADGSHLYALRDELVQALQQLPTAQRTAVVLFYLYDLDVNQVAQQTQTSVGAVKTNLHRGRKRLAEVMGTSLSEMGADSSREAAG